MACYLKIDTIKGNVTTKGFEGCIAVHGVSHTGQRAFRHRVGTAHTEMGIPELSYLSFHKSTDEASAQLWQYFVSGKSIPEVTFTRCHLNSGQAEWQSKISLQNVFVTSIQEDAHDVAGSETIELSYRKIERSYRSQNTSGSWQTPKHTSYNLETAEVG